MGIRLDEKAVTEYRRGASSGHPVVPYWDAQMKHVANGLTPSRLASLLKNAEQGDIRDQVDLFADMLERDPTMSAAFETRIHGVLSKKWEVVPMEGEGAQARRQAQRITDVLEAISGRTPAAVGSDVAEFLTFDDVLRTLLGATAYGFAPVCLDWDKATWTVASARTIDPRHFIWGDQLKAGSVDAVPYRLFIRTADEPAQGVEVQPLQYLIHVHRARPGLPSRFGLLRGLSWWYLFKNFAVRSMLQYAEAHGMPLRIGYYPAEGDVSGGTDRQVVEEAVRGLGTDAAAVLSSASKIDIISPKAESTVHDRIIAAVNAEISKLILGHASTTESTPGKLGAEDQAMAVQYYRIESDARALERTINAQLVAPMCMFGEGTVKCFFKIRYEAEEDMNSRAERIAKLAPVLGIPESYIREQFDIPEPDEGEPVTQLHLASQDPLTLLMAKTAAQDAARGAAAGASQGTNSGTPHPGAHTHGHSVSQPPRLSAAGLFINAQHAPAQAERVAKDMAARTALSGAINEGASAAIPLYEGLLKGVDPKGDYAEQIDANLPAFREALEEHMRGVLGEAQAASDRRMAMPEGQPDVKPNTATGPLLNRVGVSPDAFSLRNFVAEKWLKFHAFTMSAIEGEQITELVKATIASALSEGLQKGMGTRQFMAGVLDRIGCGRVNGFHLETIHRTNVGTAYTASTLATFERNKGAFPGWQFMAVVDPQTTEECTTLDGKTFAHGDNTYFPPIHFNCRSIGSPVHASEWEREGYQPEKPGVDLPAGFENTAVRDYVEWVNECAKDNAKIREIINQYED